MASVPTRSRHISTRSSLSRVVRIRAGARRLHPTPPAVTEALVHPGMGPAPDDIRSFRIDPSPGELVDQPARFMVAVLDGRALHEVRGWAEQWAADAAVLGDLAAAEGVDDHAG